MRAIVFPCVGGPVYSVFIIGYTLHQQVTRIRCEQLTTSWEPASCIPPDLISEFESGIRRNIGDEQVSTGGGSIHTLSSILLTSQRDRS